MKIYAKIKYLILILFLFGIFFSIYNYNYSREEYFYYPEYKYILILVFCLIIFFLLPRKLKFEIKIIPIAALLISLVILFINFDLLTGFYEEERINRIYVEYATKDCSIAKEKFKTDLKNNSLKYFSFSMAYPIVFSKNLEKYDVEFFHQGCSSFGEYNCYNKLVEDYFFQKFNIKIDDLN